MIRFQLSRNDLERLRFAYSPLAEVAESLYVLHSGQIPDLHRAWWETTRKHLTQVDMSVLSAIVPAPGPHVASFLLAGASAPSTSIDHQLSMVAGMTPERLRADLEVVWRGDLPRQTRQLLEHGGASRIAEALRQYWAVAIGPYWPQIRAVLDGDVAYRAARLAHGGIEALLGDLHTELGWAEHAITIQSSAAAAEHRLTGGGLALVPCVFAWPHVMADAGSGRSASITYGPRGIGELWPTVHLPSRDPEALGALLGHSRAAILLGLGLPRSTSDLAQDLKQGMPAVSAHLAVLRRAGLVTSWRSGRRVLYQRTSLATSVVAASGGLVVFAGGG